MVYLLIAWWFSVAMLVITRWYHKLDSDKYHQNLWVPSPVWSVDICCFKASKGDMNPHAGDRLSTSATFPLHFHCLSWISSNPHFCWPQTGMKSLKSMDAELRHRWAHRLLGPLPSLRQRWRSCPGPLPSVAAVLKRWRSRWPPETGKSRRSTVEATWTLHRFVLLPWEMLLANRFCVFFYGKTMVSKCF